MSGLALRPYQQEAIAAIERAADRGVRRPLLVLATGLGKTVCFASLIAKRGGSALVLAHRDELLRQAAEKIRLAHPDLGMAVGFVAAARNDVRAPVVIGSVQTLARESRLAQLPREFTTVVVDEGHHAVSRSYRRILEHLSPAALVLGVTATPSRSDGGLGEVWEEIVYQYGVLDGIRNGYLADVRGIRVGLQTRLEDVSQSGGDFDQEQLGEALEAASAPEHAVRVYQRHADGRKALLFAPTVKLARTFAAVFREAGIPAEAVDGTTPPDERAAMFERIQTGETRVLANVGVASEGTDLPAVDAIIMGTPTRSQIKYAQAIGRGLRTHPGKEDCLVIDLVGVSDRLELQTLPRLFGLREQPNGEESVVDALDRQQAEDRRQAEQHKQASGRRPQAPEGTLRSRDARLLGRRRRARRLHWLRHEEYWLLSLGQAGLLALAPAGERWTVERLHQGRVERLASGVDLGYAHGIAEDYTRAAAAQALAAPNARWRQKPITDAQVGLLRRLGITPPDGASKGEASDLITVARAAELLDRLAGKAA